MQYINQQDLFNTARSRKYQAILYDLRSKNEFDEFRLIKAWNLDINSINKDLSLVKQSQSASKEFLKVVYGWEKVEKRDEVNIYIIWDKNTETPLKDIYSIFSNCIAPSRIFALDADFDTFKQKYSVICSSSADAKQKGKTLCRFPNEIIPNLFLGGYNDADEMMVILQELKITHVLNCAREFTSGIPNDEKQEYKIPNGVVVNHIKMIDQPRQPIKDRSWKGSNPIIKNIRYISLASSK
ncbi:MAG: hypothetical protein EZS28_023516 [Streblomastix strix]|uniref:Rhodanese domain-containing protein n=1 Tax=Streblomastix strix TaxID=222440 RepID=A0A5J4VEX2_9EUKA|nr:MAG: hypothetical protein EZS28_023516 [Streblomastix strix]